MGIAYDYLARRHSQAYADAIELDRVHTDIKRMEDQMEKVEKELAGARQYAGVLTNSIATAQQLVEEECKRNEWPLPEPPAEPPAPAPIGDRIGRVDVGTLAFPVVRVAQPWAREDGATVCGQPECGGELTQQGDVWVHLGTDTTTCKPEAAAETRPDDDPTRFQKLDPAVVHEAVNGGE